MAHPAEDNVLTFWLPPRYDQDQPAGFMRKLYVCGLVLLVSFSPNAPAAYVTTCDDASLRAAIAEGGLVTFGCSGTIVLTQAITITTNVVLNGVGALVTISGNDQVPLFNVSLDVEFQIANLQLTRGVGQFGGAISNDGGRLVLNGVTITSNNATPSTFVGPGAGGGIYSRGGTVIAAGCLFSSNRVHARHGFVPLTARGGAICMDGGSLQLTDSLFQSNTAEGGPGNNSSPGFSVASGVEAAGAAIYSDGPATAQRCRFFSNSAFGGLGAGGVPFTSFLSGGSGGAANGGVIYSLGTMQLNDSTFANNVASGGAGGPGVGAGGSGGGGGFVYGGVILNGGSFSVANSTFITNIAGAGSGSSPSGGSSGGAGGNGGSGGYAFGGAIFSTNLASVYLTNCTIIGNVLAAAPGQAGGAGGACTGAGCTGGAGGRGGNGGTAAGGGMYVMGGTSPMVHCTFDGNAIYPGSAGSGGGGGAGRSPGGPGPAGAAGTAGTAFGGALCVATGNVQVANSIFSRSQGSTNCSGSLLDLGVNICSDQSSCFTNPASLRNLDPALQTLANNGGPTMTAALSPTSPAYNRGSNSFAPPSDQRGVPRPQGKFCDVGAFEVGHLTIEKSGDTALIRYGAPQGSFYRLQGRPNWNDWRDLGGDNARADGYVRYGPIPMTNQLEVFRTVKP